MNAPRRVYGSGKARVEATIAGYGTEPAKRRVSLVLNGRELDSKSVDVPAGGRAAVEFQPADLPFGLNRGEVHIDSGDNLPDDDRFYFSLERAEDAPRAVRTRGPQPARRAVLPHGPRSRRGIGLCAGRRAGGTERQPGPAQIRVRGAFRCGAAAGQASKPHCAIMCAQADRCWWRWAATRPCAIACRCSTRPSSRRAITPAMATAFKPPPGWTPGIPRFTTRSIGTM